MNNCLRTWPAPQPVIKGMAVPTDILSGRERASSKSNLPNVPLLFSLPLLSPGAYTPKGPSQKSWLGRRDKPLSAPSNPPSTSLQPHWIFSGILLSSRGLPLLPLGPISACLLIILMITTVAVQGGSLRPSWGCPQAASQGEALLELDGRGLSLRFTESSGNFLGRCGSASGLYPKGKSLLHSRIHSV